MITTKLVKNGELSLIVFIDSVSLQMFDGQAQNGEVSNCQLVPNHHTDTPDPPPSNTAASSSATPHHMSSSTPNVFAHSTTGLYQPPDFDL